MARHSKRHRARIFRSSHQDQTVVFLFLLASVATHCLGADVAKGRPEFKGRSVVRVLDTHGTLGSDSTVALNAAMDDAVWLGKGFYGAVYQMPGTSKVLKIPTSLTEDVIGNFPREVADCARLDASLSEISSAIKSRELVLPGSADAELALQTVVPKAWLVEVEIAGDDNTDSMMLPAIVKDMAIGHSYRSLVRPRRADGITPEMVADGKAVVRAFMRALYAHERWVAQPDYRFDDISNDNVMYGVLEGQEADGPKLILIDVMMKPNRVSKADSTYVCDQACVLDRYVWYWDMLWLLWAGPLHPASIRGRWVKAISAPESDNADLKCIHRVNSHLGEFNIDEDVAVDGWKDAGLYHWAAGGAQLVLSTFGGHEPATDLVDAAHAVEAAHKIVRSIVTRVSMHNGCGELAKHISLPALSLAVLHLYPPSASDSPGPVPPAALTGVVACPLPIESFNLSPAELRITDMLLECLDIDSRASDDGVTLDPSRLASGWLVGGGDGGNSGGVVLLDGAVMRMPRPIDKDWYTRETKKAMEVLSKRVK